MKLTIQCELCNSASLLTTIFQWYLVDKAIYVNMDSSMTEILSCEHFRKHIFPILLEVQEPKALLLFQLEIFLLSVISSHLAAVYPFNE